MKKNIPIDPTRREVLRTFLTIPATTIPTALPSGNDRASDVAEGKSAQFNFVLDVG